jgi:hypothetical protein
MTDDPWACMSTEERALWRTTALPANDPPPDLGEDEMERNFRVTDQLSCEEARAAAEDPPPMTPERAARAARLMSEVERMLAASPEELARWPRRQRR